MAEQERACKNKFQIWVAFLMGMVIIVIAIVFFDKVLGIGRYGDNRGVDEIREDGLGRVGSSVTTQEESYLTLTGGTTSPDVWLGIEATDVSESTAKKLGYDIGGGVLVSRVIERSPADEAGVQRGDIIYELDRREVESVSELLRVLAKLDPDSRVRVDLFRDDSREALYIKLAAASTSTAPTSSIPAVGEVIRPDQKWGIVVSELTDSLRRSFAIPATEEGVVVLTVLAGSAASRAGIKRGDLIQKIDRSEVETMTEFFEVLQSSSSRHILLTVYRQGTQLHVHVVAVSPFMPAGGPSEGDDDEEVKGYKGQPGEIPPQGQAGSADG